MTKSMIIGLLVGFMVTFGAAYLFSLDSREFERVSSEDFNLGEEIDLGLTVEACDVFTESIAIEIIGPSASKFNSDEANASTNDVSVTQCLYDDGTASLDSLIANVLVRGAKTGTGSEGNRFGFDNIREVNAEDISGIGDQAYWNPGSGQVNVLINDGQYWLIVQVGAGLNEQDQAKTTQLATLIANQL